MQIFYSRAIVTVFIFKATMLIPFLVTIQLAMGDAWESNMLCGLS